MIAEEERQKLEELLPYLRIVFHESTCSASMDPNRDTIEIIEKAIKGEDYFYSFSGQDLIDMAERAIKRGPVHPPTSSAEGAAHT